MDFLLDSFFESESESDMYSATINEDYYAEAGVVSKGVSASCN